MKEILLNLSRNMIEISAADNQLLIKGAEYITLAQCYHPYWCSITLAWCFYLTRKFGNRRPNIRWRIVEPMSVFHHPSILPFPPCSGQMYEQQTLPMMMVEGITSEIEIVAWAERRIWGCEARLKHWFWFGWGKLWFV